MFDLLFAELKKSCLDFIRYPSEGVISALILLILFFCLFFGAQYMAGGAGEEGDKIDEVIVSYIAWVIVLYNLVYIANDIQKDAQTGVLQQVFLSGYAPEIVFLARLIINSLLAFIVSLIILFVIVSITGRQLEFSVNALSSTGAVLVGSVGLSFIVGAVVLLTKRVQQIVGLSQFLLLILIMIPFERLDGSLKLIHYALPISPASGSMREAMIVGIETSLAYMLLGFLNGLFYLALGIGLFKLAVDRGRRAGNLGWY